MSSPDQPGPSIPRKRRLGESIMSPSTQPAPAIDLATDSSSEKEIGKGKDREATSTTKKGSKQGNRAQGRSG
jgi:hypothetical protein